MDTNTLPPFPDDVPSHPLLVIDYALIKANDEAEKERLWTAGTSLGFWYLKNHGVDSEVQGMFEMGAETMALPMEEKMKYEQGDDGVSFGYKAAGANAVDASGTLDTAQFINVAKDDALAWPQQARRSYPRTVDARMDMTIKPFVEKALDVNMTLIAVFNDKLGLPKDTLAKQHLREEYSGSETRVLYSPPAGKDTQAIGAHTDFGSLSFLHNRLGGLQVFVPGSEDWQYVKPIPGHAICNLGDAMAIFSGGILRSNLHRVVSPPGLQSTHYRFSLVFFTRPGNSIVLRALKEESSMIADAVARAPDAAKYETGATSLEWFTRRIKNQRIKNRTGPETWMASRGTEHTEHTAAGNEIEASA
ncbi:Clavaminate synthase-like protein [Mycena indigotica]|uniref:Clavaminate synthase-like protein n=1 Tax=Mycena indigotica TaxID=2126181 RepID=A0A8H6T3S0_9AGAR|nr:Clavaminate synthase-like protein [Mycena indigotica]KAF7309357.1 Clavaminate synthase-like protein [Mycena indigotica]